MESVNYVTEGKNYETGFSTTAQTIHWNIVVFCIETTGLPRNSVIIKLAGFIEKEEIKKITLPYPRKMRKEQKNRNILNLEDMLSGGQEV